MGSSDKDILKELVQRKIKKVYVGALRCIEMRFGDSFDGFDQIRREILRIGNDAVRDIHDVIDKSFDIEKAKDVFTINFIGKEKENENG